MPSIDAFRSLVIVNPASAAGATGRRWDRIATCLRSSLGEFEHVATHKPGEASTLSRAALREGFEMVVSVGGDGTLNEVVGGFFEGSVAVAPQAVLGVVALGTGCDFARTIGQTDVESACARLAGRNTRSIDVGLARFSGHDGAPATRIFINVASFGCSGLVAHLVSSRLKAVSGQWAFTLATLRALAVYRDKTVALKFDGRPPRTFAITNCAVGNGRYFGAGMQVAPTAQLDDGELDVTIWSGFGLVRARWGLLCRQSQPVSHRPSMARVQIVSKNDFDDFNSAPGFQNHGRYRIVDSNESRPQRCGRD